MQAPPTAQSSALQRNKTITVGAVAATATPERRVRQSCHVANELLIWKRFWKKNFSSARLVLAKTVGHSRRSDLCSCLAKCSVSSDHADSRLFRYASSTRHTTRGGPGYRPARRHRQDRAACHSPRSGEWVFDKVMVLIA